MKVFSGMNINEVTSLIDQVLTTVVKGTESNTYKFATRHHSLTVHVIRGDEPLILFRGVMDGTPEGFSLDLNINEKGKLLIKGLRKAVMDRVFFD